jgi:hypothetical protein
MSLSSQTYSDLFAEVEALCGKSFTDVEARRVNRLLNLAARRAYRESVWWERYLVVSQPRTVSRGEIEFSEDSYQVYGAGTSEVNGLYVRNGDQNGFPAYTKYDSSGDAEYSVFVETPLALNTWTIQAGSPSSPTGNELYIHPDIDVDISPTPPASGWDVASSAGLPPVPYSDEPAPLLVDLQNIDTCMMVNREDILECRGYYPIQFHVSGRGIVINNSEKVDGDVAYVTYKKTFTDVYGDGTGGTTSDIPSEWFNYMALYAARQQQISQRQGNGSPYAAIASREVDEALQDELMKLEEQNISNGIAKRIQTHMQYNTQLQ